MFQLIVRQTNNFEEIGELHLEIIIDRLNVSSRLEMIKGAPQVAYKETLTKNTSIEVYKKQTGGKGKLISCLK